MQALSVIVLFFVFIGRGLANDCEGDVSSYQGPFYYEDAEYKFLEVKLFRALGKQRPPGGSYYAAYEVDGELAYVESYRWGRVIWARRYFNEGGARYVGVTTVDGRCLVRALD